jgi:NADH dehydrogenase
MSRVLVTGANGFIGTALVPRLVAAGHVPRLLVRRTPVPAPPPPVEVVVGDVADPQTLAGAVAGTHAVVHLAAATSGGRMDKRTAFLLNVGSASSLVDACRTHGARLVVMSTQHVHLPRPGLYGRTKLMADRLLLDSGIAVTILRPSLVYGPGRSGVFVKLAGLIRALPVLPVLGPGTWTIRPLFLDDLLAVVVEILARPETAGRVYDMGGPDLVTYNDFVTAIGASMGRPVRTVHLPLRLAYAIAWVLERLLSKPPLTTENVYGAVYDAHCDARPLERDLRPPLTPLAEGLRRTVTGAHA